MKTKLFFELAKANGINESEIRISNSTSISVDTLNGQIDSYNVSEIKSIRARGIINGKFGVAITNIEDKNTPQYLVDSILATGKYIEKEEDAKYFKEERKRVRRVNDKKEKK